MAAAPLSRPQAAFTLVILVFSWGLSWSIFKGALHYMPPLWYACLRMALGCAVLMPVLAWRGQLKRPARADAPMLFVLGVVMMAFYPALTHTGLLWVESGRASIVAYLMPLWVTPGAILFLGERLTRLKAAGLALAVGGVAVLFNPAGFDWSNPDVVLGNAMMLLASVTWAGTILYIRTVRWRLSPLELAPWQLLIACIVLGAMAAATEPLPSTASWDWSFAGLLLYAGPYISILTVWGLMAVNRSLPAITTSFGYLAAPVCGVAFGALLRGEALTASNVGGLSLVVAGLAAVAIAEARERGERL